jgi:hypothetical protein
MVISASLPLGSGLLAVATCGDPLACRSLSILSAEGGTHLGAIGDGWSHRNGSPTARGHYRIGWRPRAGPISGRFLSKAASPNRSTCGWARAHYLSIRSSRGFSPDGKYKSPGWREKGQRGAELYARSPRRWKARSRVTLRGARINSYSWGPDCKRIALAGRQVRRIRYLDSRTSGGRPVDDPGCRPRAGQRK